MNLSRINALNLVIEAFVGNVTGLVLTSGQLKQIINLQKKYY